MSKSTSIILGNHFDEFVSKQVKSGRFGSASELIREGLRLVEERELKLDALRAALIEGEQSGIAENYSIENIITELDKES